MKIDLVKNFALSLVFVLTSSSAVTAIPGRWGFIVRDPMYDFARKMTGFNHILDLQRDPNCRHSVGKLGFRVLHHDGTTAHGSLRLSKELLSTTMTRVKLENFKEVVGRDNLPRFEELKSYVQSMTAQLAETDDPQGEATMRAAIGRTNDRFIHKFLPELLKHEKGLFFALEDLSTRLNKIFILIPADSPLLKDSVINYTGFIAIEISYGRAPY